MQPATRELYRSSNGDRWSLVRDDLAGKVLILHEPNAASGGKPSHLECDGTLHIMLSDIGFAMMEATIKHAGLRAEDVSDEAPI